MSKVRVIFTEKFFIEDHTITYHGVLIPLYGLLDEFIDIYYINIVSPEVKLYYERKFKHNLTIEQKLRLIAETDRGRLIIKEFSEFGTNASFAETKRRFVPDWYIHPNGPISSLTTGNHSYSEYYYLPLNSEERWKRYVGTLPPSVPLFVSLFQQTSSVIARIVTGWSSRGTGSPPSGPPGPGGPGGSSRGTGSGPGSSPAISESRTLSKIDVSLTVDAGEISSPLRSVAKTEKLPTADDMAAALAFDQTPIGELPAIGEGPKSPPIPLAPQSESEILTTEEVISKKDWPDPLDTTEYIRPPDSPPTYDDSKKDVLVRYNPDSEEKLSAYSEIATGEIGTALSPPYNIKEFMKNALSIKYVKTEHEIYELVKDPNFQKYFPKNFNFEDHSDIDEFKSHVVRAYIRLVSSIGYRYADFNNLKQLFNVQVRYFHDQDPQKIKDQIIKFNAESYDYSLIENELTVYQLI